MKEKSLLTFTRGPDDVSAHVRGQVSPAVRPEPSLLPKTNSSAPDPGCPLSLPGQPEDAKVCQKSGLGEVYQENFGTNVGDSTSKQGWMKIIISVMTSS